MLNTPRRSWSVAEQAAYFTHCEARPEILLLGVFPRATRDPVGLFLLQLQPRAGTFTVSHLLGDVAWRGKGVSEEASEAIFDCFFDRLGYAKAWANIRSQNRVILWFMLKDGLWRKEARLASHVRDPETGQRSDLFVLGLLAKDWRSARRLPGR